MNFTPIWHGLRIREVNQYATGESRENQMRYDRYDDRDIDWEARFRRACRGREGFAWGAFLIGFILGGIIF